MQIQDLRLMKNLSYEKFGQLTGIPSKRLYNQRFKKINKIPLDESIKLAEYLGISVYKLNELAEKNNLSNMLDDILKEDE